MLTVTNKNGFTLNDRFDGIDYSFPPNSSVAVTEDAARHIFGLGAADKKDTLARLGWMISSNDYQAGIDKLNNFVFNVLSEVSPGEVVTEQGTAPLQVDPPEAETNVDASGGAASKVSKFIEQLGG